MKNMQTYALTRILAGDKLLRILESSAVSKENMTLSILFNFLSDKIFSELNTIKSIDMYRRNLQRIYVSQLEKLMDAKATAYLISNEPGTMYEMEYKPVEISNTDIPGVARYNLSELLKKMRLATLTANDVETKMHLDEMLIRIKNILESKSEH